MKKFLFAAASLFLLGLLCACGAGGASAGGSGSAADYAALIAENRNEEDNAFLPVITSPGDPDFSDVFTVYSLNADDMQRYAVSISRANTKSYGIAVILPAAGRTDAVIGQMEAFIEMQKRLQENYLPDQYDIASSALLDTAPSGEVVMVMAPDASTIMANILAGLAG